MKDTDLQICRGLIMLGTVAAKNKNITYKGAFDRTAYAINAVVRYIKEILWWNQVSFLILIISAPIHLLDKVILFRNKGLRFI
uniref:Uncharacterized protein n=1 Tax=Ignisphaera aggregans TaxID=334771 RepID=A0A7C4JIM5_9CREN